MISQVFSDESTAMVLDRRCPLTGLDMRTRVVLAFMTNGVWLPVFNNESGKQVSLTANVIYVDACGCMRCFEKASINTYKYFVCRVLPRKIHKLRNAFGVLSSLLRFTLAYWSVSIQI